MGMVLSKKKKKNEINELRKHKRNFEMTIDN